MDTPLWNLESTINVYEPAEDSFLLLDGLESDLPIIKGTRPAVVVEIGSGSGVIVTALARSLSSSVHCVAIDISSDACKMTQETAVLNKVQVDVLQGDLLKCLRACSPGLIDLLVFNPPYVVTPDHEIAGTLQRAWAGGNKGRVVIDRLLDQISDFLSPKALFYLLLIKENNPEEILENMNLRGFDGIQIAFKKIRGEHLVLLRFTRRLL